MINIKQTEAEYLLFIPPAQKERARAIDGRRWDQDRKCWVYPRTNRMYDALIAEFGDDLLSISITRPSPGLDKRLQPIVAREITQSLQAENRNLRDDLAKIHESLEIIKNANGNARTPEIQDLKTALATREATLLEMRRRIELQDKELQQLRRSLQEAENNADQMKAQHSLLQKDAANRQSNVNDLKAQLKRMIVQSAIDASGTNVAFTQLLDRVELNDSFCVAVGRELERELRHRLKVEDKSMSLYELITQASDANILTPDGVDLAHALRKQRNKMAHDGADSQTHTARMLLSLYTSALLWHELSEQMS